jgi:hypothetical protein
VGATADAGQDSAAPGKDAGPDTSIVDAGHDVSIDAGKDVTTDAGHDVSTGTLDAGKDAAIDAGDTGCATSTPCP